VEYTPQTEMNGETKGGPDETLLVAPFWKLR